MKLLFKQIKTEKKKKHNDKIKQLEIEFGKMKYADNPDKLQNALKEVIKIHVVNKKLHEFENEILLDYTGEFEMIGELSISDHICQTHISFRNITDSESYFNAIDQDYKSEDANFKGHTYKIDIPQFKLVNGSQYEICCDFKHEITEYRGNNCFIPTKGYCFIKCINYLTNFDFKNNI